MNRIAVPAQSGANPSPRGGRSARTHAPPATEHRGLPLLSGLFLLAAALLLASCITIPKPAPDEDVCVAPSLGGYDYFWYFSSADPFLSLDSKRAEIIRLERFRKWLVRNGYETPRIEVVSRRVEAKRQVLGMTVYDLKYLVKVEQPGDEKKTGKETPEQGATGEAATAPREDTQRNEESVQGKDPAQMKGGAAQESVEPGIQVEKLPPEERKDLEEQETIEGRKPQEERNPQEEQKALEERKTMEERTLPDEQKSIEERKPSEEQVPATK